MKKLLLLLLALLMLTGCGREEGLPTEMPATEPETDWVAECGMPWDKAGVLTELPVTVPDGLPHTAIREFSGDVLLWSVDAHLAGAPKLELSVLELDTGRITAQRDVEMSSYTVPQTLGDCIYLCDSEGGTVIQLDKSLQELGCWKTEPIGGSWYMGAGNILYQQDMDYHLRQVKLETGESEPVFPGDPHVMISDVGGDTLALRYYRDDTGAQCWASLDLRTGEIAELDVGRNFDSVNAVGAAWIASGYDEGYLYQYGGKDRSAVNVEAGAMYLQLLDDGKILATTEDNTDLILHDPEGAVLASCRLSDNGSYSAGRPIWNEKYGGYFLIVSGYEDRSRILFWDITRGGQREPLVFSEIQPLSEATLTLKGRCDEIGGKYGVQILVGEECDGVYTDFTGEIVTDPDRVYAALDVLEDAMADYPEGFFRQLRHDSIQTVQIQLVGNLMADGSGRTGDGYVAFTQEMWDHYLIVADLDDASEQSYYHEFSHVIDNCLEWDTYSREDALFSEDAWMELNPGWFGDYSYDYGADLMLDDYTSFIDSYSMISPTEDRARVMEFAMIDSGKWRFTDAPVLEGKLEYYCQCIRDAFDTSGWPQRTLWEQYLN